MTVKEKRPLQIVAATLALMVLIVVLGGLRLHGVITASFEHIDSIDHLVRANSDLLRAQLDEETGIRGYVATRNGVFLEPYIAARAIFPNRQTELRKELVALGNVNSIKAADDLFKLHTLWERRVANAVLLNNETGRALLRKADDREVNGKLIVDQIRADFNDVDGILNAERREVMHATRASIDSISFFVAAAVLIFLSVGVLLVRYQLTMSELLEASRLRAREIQSELSTKQHIAELLQDALSQRPLPALPSVRFSATYVPASEQAKVGGDWYDAIELSQNRVLFIIGDVAGHGIEAAVGMSRARQAFIGSALKNPDPAHVLAAVNAELHAQNSPMVTAVCGVADSDRYEFTYATAGHPPPLLIEPGHGPRMLPCGGLPLGVIPTADYVSKVVQTVPEAMLVLYTDGAVEHSHDVLAGERMLIEAARHCHDEQAVEPATAIHRAIFAGREAGDDVAILTMGFTSERQTGMTISAEHLHGSFSGKIRRMPSIPPIGYDSFGHLGEKLVA